MKKKKICILFLCLFQFVAGIFGNSMTLQAKASDKPVIGKIISGTGSEIKRVYDDGRWKVAYWKDGISKTKLQSSGEIVFCIEPETIGFNGTYYENVNAIPGELRKKLSKIVYHGWDNTKKTDIDYAVTQYMIWEAIGGVVTRWYGDFGRKYPALKKKVQDKINHHEDKPSFHKGTYTVDMGKTLSITDKNKVLNQFHTADAGGANVRIEGNKLLVTPNANTAESITIKLNKVPSKFVGTTIIYQSKEHNGQDVGKFKLNDPVSMYLKVKVNKRGSLKIAKKDEDGNYVPNTKFKTSYNPDMSGSTWTYTTGADGTVTIDNWQSKTVYIQEVEVPKHLVLDPSIKSIQIKPNQTVTYTAKNNWVKGKVKLRKTDSKTGTQVAGATYGIYDNQNRELERLVTTATGYVESNYLRFGDYTVKEIIPPTGYVLNPNVYHVTVSTNEQKIEVNATDKPIEGYIQAIKKDIDTGKTVVAANTTFSVYKSDDTYVGDITTNGKGIAKTDLVRYGDYYLVEKTAPNGYVQSDKRIVYKIREDGKTYEAELSNKRVLGSVDLSKEDSKTGKTPLGEATLEGAEYGLYANADILDPADGSVLHKKDKKIATLTTDKDGNAGVDNLYLGSYYVKEIKASDGYTLDETKNEFALTYKDQHTSVVTKKQTVLERVKAQAFQIIKVSDDGTEETKFLQGAEFTIKLKKDVDKLGWDDAPIAKNAQGKPASVMVSDKKGYAVSDKLPYGTYIVKETKVPADHYAVEDFEVQITEDSREPQEWRVLTDQKFRALIKVVKLDQETGKTVLLPNTTFKIKNLETNEYVEQWVFLPIPHKVTEFKTTEDGTVTTPTTLTAGTYQLEEIHAPFGYVLNEEPIRFEVRINSVCEVAEDGKTPIIIVTKEDVSQKGTILVKKQGEKLAGIKQDDKGNIQFIYENQNVNDAEFQIKADEDIYSADNQKDLIYKKGQVVDTVKGNKATKQLPLGKYSVHEVVAGHGFILNTEIKKVELKYAGETVEVVNEETSYINERQKTLIEVSKQDKENQTKLQGAVFGIYAKEDIASVTGNVLVKKGTLIETVTTDENGKALLKADLPMDHKYEVREIKAPIGYAGTNEVIEINTQYQGQEKTTISFKPLFENEITRVEVSKKDITNNEEIAGATLTVYPKGNKAETFDTWVSGQDGTNEDGTIKPHIIKGLEVGKTYVLEETSSPYGYAIAQNVEFTISDTGNVQSVEMKDEMVVGQLKWNKNGELFNQTVTGQTEFGKTESPVWNKSNLLGAEITIYADEDITIGNHTYYKKDEAIEVLESDWKEVLSKKLLVGKYYYKETKVPHGYIQDTEKHQFEIKDNQINELQVVVSTLANTRAKVNIDMTKVLEEQEIFKNPNAYKDVVFGIYAREDIYDYMGNVAIENGTLIYTSGINKDGTLTLADTFDLPNGVYYIKELTTNPQYVLNDTEYDFEIAYQGKDITSYKVSIGENGIINNELARGSILVHKVDADDQDKVLSGVEFHLSDKKDMSNIIKTVKTDDKGIAEFKDLELGTYYVQEAKQLDGYVLNDAVYEVKVSRDKDVLEITCVNKPTEMEFSKVDITNNEELPGATIIVTDKETGKLIDKWVSTKESHKIKYLVEGKEYVMTELMAPKGYQVAESITFVAKDNTKITMKDRLNEVVPDTGVSTQGWIFLCIIGFSGCIFVLKIRKKHTI